MLLQTYSVINWIKQILVFAVLTILLFTLTSNFNFTVKIHLNQTFPGKQFLNLPLDLFEHFLKLLFKPDLLENTASTSKNVRHPAILLLKRESWPSEPGESEPAVSGFSIQSRSTVALSNLLFRRYETLKEKAEES